MEKQDKKAEQKEYARINKEITITIHKMEIIEAKITKEIWLDPSFDKEKLRKAELILRLEENEEYKTLQEKYWELEEQKQQLNYFDDFCALDHPFEI